MLSIFQKFILPGIIFQSVVIGGGYATGREIVEFFFASGPIGGLLGIIVAMVVWSVSLALSFELARLTKSYDYNSFFAHLLGRFSFLFEIAFLILIILVISTLGAAAGGLIASNFGVSAVWGTSAMMVAVAVLVFYGSETIEKVLAGWSFLLYGAYFTFVVFCFIKFGDKITHNFSVSTIEPGWFMGGLSYSGYNLASMTAVLFCLHHITTRKEAILAGLLAGPIAMIPAILFFVAMVGYYPEIVTQDLPVNFLLSVLDVPVFKIIFEIILFGTFIETGAANIHAVNERVSKIYEGKSKTMPRFMRPAIAMVILFTAIVLATKFGLVNLIASGYGTLTYAFIILIIGPLFTIGIWKIYKSRKS